MNPEDSHAPCRDPFDEALEALLSGEADTRAKVILNETLRIDPEARRAYIRAMAFEGMLAAEFAPIEVSAPARSPRRWWFPASIAATILVSACLAWLWIPARDSAVADADPDETGNHEFTHAVISLLDGAHGQFAGASLATGRRLADGMLDLESGLAEITFDSGAEVTLEGPAKFLLESGSRSRLDSGRASAIVPEQARGFVIHTPTSYIKDLGNAVSVEVRNDEETDLHVLDGEVEVVPTGKQAANSPRVIRKMEAVRLSGKKVESIEFRPDRKAIGKSGQGAPIPPSVHWSFDDWNGSNGLVESRAPAIKWIADRKPADPTLVPGPFGRALRFDGKAAFAKTGYQAASGFDPRTIAFWVRIPSNADPLAGSNGIAGWGTDHMNAKWQILWNQQAIQGTLGAPRVELGDGYIVGSTDLRDGEWHHLAVVILGGPKTGVASHVRIYLDGRLEPPSGRRQQRVKSGSLATESQPLAFGRVAGDRRNKQPSFLDGEIDEAHVFEGALLPRQIVRLMKRNSLAAPAK